MKLYYSPGACSLSPHIVLEESGLAYEAVAAPTKTHRLADGTDYYTINPLGYVPLLELDDGTRLREGPAIVQYIADQVPAKALAPAASTMERYHLVEQYRYPVGARLWEFPQGSVGGPEPMSPDLMAAVELAEAGADFPGRAGGRLAHPLPEALLLPVGVIEVLRLAFREHAQAQVDQRDDAHAHQRQGNCAQADPQHVDPGVIGDPGADAHDLAIDLVAVEFGARRVHWPVLPLLAIMRSNSRWLRSLAGFPRR